MNEQQQKTCDVVKVMLMRQLQLLHEESEKTAVRDTDLYDRPRDLAALSEAMEKIAGYVVFLSPDCEAENDAPRDGGKPMDGKKRQMEAVSRNFEEDGDLVLPLT